MIFDGIKYARMISDRQLDDYNRVLMYYLFLNFNINLYGENKQRENKTRLRNAMTKLPAYLTAKIAEN